MDDVNYFQQKLYQSLNVPLSRLQPNQNFSLGRSNEITRDELKFHKFVARLRSKFGNLLLDTLRIQLVAKNVVTVDDWKELEKSISVTFVSDNSFEELKEVELMNSRMAMLQQLDPFVGKWFGPEFVYKKVLRFDDETIEEVTKDIKSMDERFIPMEQRQIEANQQELNAEPDTNNPTPPIEGDEQTQPPIQN